MTSVGIKFVDETLSSVHFEPIPKGALLATVRHIELIPNHYNMINATQTNVPNATITQTTHLKLLQTLHIGPKSTQCSTKKSKEGKIQDHSGLLKKI